MDGSGTDIQTTSDLRNVNELDPVVARPRELPWFHCLTEWDKSSGIVGSGRRVALGKDLNLWRTLSATYLSPNG